MVCCNLQEQARLSAKSSWAAAASNSHFDSATTNVSHGRSNRGDQIFPPDETAILPRPSFDPQHMAPPRGLKLEVLEGDGDTVCPEHQTADHLNNSRGLTSHHLLRLPFGRFSFRVTLNNDEFQWHNSNALQFLIDFDSRHHNLELFVLRDANYTLKPQQLSFLNSRGERRVYISSVMRLNYDFEEKLTFENRPIEDYGTATSSRRQGTIWVMVKRCNLQYSKLDHTPSPAVTTNMQMPNQAVLESEGILSCIKLTGSSPRAIQRRMFKVVSSTPSASFVFHYRVPEEFERIRSLEHYEDNGTDEMASRGSVTKNEIDQSATPRTDNVSWGPPNVRLPSGDTITLTPDNTSCDAEDDELEDLTALLDAIDSKQYELSELRQKHEADEAAFRAEKSRLEAAISAVKGQIAEATGYRKRKLQELRDELEDAGLTEKDLQGELTKLDVKMGRYKASLQAVSANKRRKISESE